MDSLLQQGIEHHRAGRLAEAQRLYRQALERRPDDPDALHLLGVLAGQTGANQAAVDLIQRAIALNPKQVAYYANIVEFLRRLGRTSQALDACRRAIDLDPNLVTIHNNLGLLLIDMNDACQAEAAFERAIQINPSFAEAYGNLGNLLRDAGRLDQAVDCCRRAAELAPKSAAAHNNLGVALQRLGQFDAAASSFETALSLAPDYFEACENLGNSLREIGQGDRACEVCRRALQLEPQSAVAHNGMGLALHQCGRLEEAIDEFRETLRLDPRHPLARGNLGIALSELGKLDEAAAASRQAVADNPQSAMAYNNLGVILKKSGILDGAIQAFHRSIELDPTSAPFHANLAGVLRESALIPEAIVTLGRAISLQPDLVVVHSSLLFTLWFDPEIDARQILVAHDLWNQRHAEPLRNPARRAPRDPNPERRLRVGYVSPDFRLHSVGAFLMPLLENHDKKNVEIFCYADVARGDDVTRRLRESADVWRATAHLSDAKLAELIVQDKIDILVDLAMHTGGNRLLVFARRAAPVQATYLSYPGTTGLKAIDYRISDRHIEQGAPGLEYAEQTICLPNCFWCYRPIVPAPPVGALPAQKAGHVTFGCFNNFAKVGPAVQELWARIMAAVPGSRLMIYAGAGAHRQRMIDRFAAHGVASDRLQFVGQIPHAQYFERFGDVDICLDPFPFAGGTTSLDGLWMGAPLVTLAGQTPVGRGGVTILSNLGLEELIAKSPDEYFVIATALAGDLARLRKLREELRPRMLAGPITGARRFAADLEAVFRLMWKNVVRERG